MEFIKSRLLDCHFKASLKLSTQINHYTARNSKAKATLAVSSKSHIRCSLYVKNLKTGQEVEKLAGVKH